MAAELLEKAKQGINPKVAMAADATSGSLTVETLGKVFLEQYVESKRLDCANKYALCILDSYQSEDWVDPGGARDPRSSP